MPTNPNQLHQEIYTILSADSSSDENCRQTIQNLDDFIRRHSQDLTVEHFATLLGHLAPHANNIPQNNHRSIRLETIICYSLDRIKEANAFSDDIAFLQRQLEQLNNQPYMQSQTYQQTLHTCCRALRKQVAHQKKRLMNDMREYSREAKEQPKKWIACIEGILRTQSDIIDPLHILLILQPTGRLLNTAPNLKAEVTSVIAATINHCHTIPLPEWGLSTDDKYGPILYAFTDIAKSLCQQLPAIRPALQTLYNTLFDQLPSSTTNEAEYDYLLHIMPSLLDNNFANVFTQNFMIEKLGYYETALFHHKPERFIKAVSVFSQLATQTQNNAIYKSLERLIRSSQSWLNRFSPQQADHLLPIFIALTHSPTLTQTCQHTAILLLTQVYLKHQPATLPRALHAFLASANTRLNSVSSTAFIDLLNAYRQTAPLNLESATLLLHGLMLVPENALAYTLNTVITALNLLAQNATAEDISADTAQQIMTLVSS